MTVRQFADFELHFPAQYAVIALISSFIVVLTSGIYGCHVSDLRHCPGYTTRRLPAAFLVGCSSMAVLPLRWDCDTLKLVRFVCVVGSFKPLALASLLGHKKLGVVAGGAPLSGA